MDAAPGYVAATRASVHGWSSHARFKVMAFTRPMLAATRRAFESRTNRLANAFVSRRTRRGSPALISLGPRCRSRPIARNSARVGRSRRLAHASVSPAHVNGRSVGDGEFPSLRLLNRADDADARGHARFVGGCSTIPGTAPEPGISCRHLALRQGINATTHRRHGATSAAHAGRTARTPFNPRVNIRSDAAAVA